MQSIPLLPRVIDYIYMTCRLFLIFYLLVAFLLISYFVIFFEIGEVNFLNLAISQSF